VVVPLGSGTGLMAGASVVVVAAVVDVPPEDTVALNPV
jgi:hypothetical protein